MERKEKLVEGEQVSDLVNKTKNLLYDESGRKLGWRVNYHPALLHTLSLPGIQGTSVRQGAGKSRWS